MSGKPETTAIWLAALVALGALVVVLAVEVSLIWASYRVFGPNCWVGWAAFAIVWTVREVSARERRT
jgi:hypothetical protein